MDYGVPFRITRLLSSSLQFSIRHTHTHAMHNGRCGGSRWLSTTPIVYWTMTGDSSSSIVADDVSAAFFYQFTICGHWTHSLHCAILNGMNSTCCAINSLHSLSRSKQQLNTIQNINLLVSNTKKGNAVAAIFGTLKPCSSNTLQTHPFTWSFWVHTSKTQTTPNMSAE